MKPPKKKDVGVGRVAFKARLDAIKEMVDAGYTTAAIHRKYGSQLGIGYTQLNNYINKFIKSKPAFNEGKEKEKPNIPASGERETTAKQATEKPTTEKEEDDEDDIEGKAASGDFF